MATGGSIREVSIGGRVFRVAADSDTNRKLGGSETEIEMNGDETHRTIRKPVPWVISGIAVVIDEDKGDHDYLQDCANGVDADEDGLFPVTITYANGRTRSGKGVPVGELSHASMNTTLPLTLSGTGRLELQ